MQYLRTSVCRGNTTCWHTNVSLTNICIYRNPEVYWVIFATGVAHLCSLRYTVTWVTLRFWNNSVSHVCYRTTTNLERCTGRDLPVILMVDIRACLLRPLPPPQVTFLTSAVDGGKMSALWSSWFMSSNWIGGWMGPGLVPVAWRKRNLCPCWDWNCNSLVVLYPLHPSHYMDTWQ
jgi:hypothetical protein